MSPRSRARRTLELLDIGCRDKLPWQDTQTLCDIRTEAKVQVTEDIREWDYGDYEGLTSVQIKEQREKSGEKVWDIWRDGCPGGESPAEVTKRLDRLIQDIRTRFHDVAIGKPKGEAPISDVLLVAHGHILRAFAMRWIGRELTDGVSLLLEGMLSPISFPPPLPLQSLRYADVFPAGGVGTMSYEHRSLHEPAIL